MSIPIVWWDQGRGNWDSGLISSIFDKHPQTFIQHNTKTPDIFERAIVIVVGKPSIEPLRAYLETLTFGLVILTSDEDAYFDYKAAIPERLEIWTQYFNSSREDIKGRLLLGPPNRLKDYKINKDLEKKYLWSFVGQSQNPFRQQCVETLKKLENGFLQVAELFGGNGANGMEYQEYLDIMCQSKYVICPAGSMSADSFRLYEAIECGAIPITDARCPRDSKDFVYWNAVYPQSQLIAVNYWDEKALKAILNFPANNDWWFVYKQRLEEQLIEYANG